MRKKSDDQVVFLTLVDFLLQLIFFGLFLFVVIQARQQEAAEGVKKLPSWVLKEEFLPFIDGLTPWVNADKAKELTDLLKTLYEKNLLADVLQFLRTNSQPIKHLKFCSASPDLCKGIIRHCEIDIKDCEAFAGKGRSLGLPPCIPQPPRALMSVVLRRDDGVSEPYIEISGITPQGREVFLENEIAIKQGEILNLANFEQRFQAVSRGRPVALCGHYVNFEIKYDSTRFFLAAERVFGRERVSY